LAAASSCLGTGEGAAAEAMFARRMRSVLSIDHGRAVWLVECCDALDAATRGKSSEVGLTCLRLCS
jgi:hypothetical protein